MELTKEQILQIETFLERRKFDYVDLKYEILDHIISDIEQKVETGISFNDAFETTTLKWKKTFEESFSFYFGAMYFAPKIVIEKAKKVYKNYFILIVASYFLPLIFFSYVDFSLSKEYQYYFNNVLQVLSILLVLINLIFMSKKKKINVKTTYSFILRTQNSSILLGAILILTNSYFRGDSSINTIAVGLFLCFAFTSLLYFKMYKKHREVSKKYKTL